MNIFHRASFLIMATVILTNSPCVKGLNDIIYSAVRQFLENEYTNNTEMVYCMLERMRKDRTYIQVFEGIMSEANEMINENVEKYLIRIEAKCNISYMSSPLGIATIFSIAVVVCGGVGFCLIRFVKPQ